MNSYFIQIGTFGIKWYSIFMIIAIVVALGWIFLEARREKIDKDFISDLAFYSILSGILGARIYYVIFNWQHYGANFIDILKIWEGGLAIHGALIGGGAFLIFYCIKNKKPVLKILDMAVVGVIMAQAIGRWGNFFNNEAYGAMTTREELASQGIPNFIINGMEQNGIYYQPTFLYESLWNLAGFVILVLMNRYGKVKIGTLTCFYLFWYGAGRFFIEGFRSDSLTFMGLKVAVVVSLMMVAVAIIGYIVLRNIKRDFYKNELNEVEA